jgi:capsular polysaccharide transport system permease protein
MTVSYILLSVIMMFSDTHSVIDVWPILAAMSLAAVLGLGVGSVNAVLMGFYPTWESIWSIITRPLFIASGILILYETLPNTVRDILWWNPLLHIVGEMRTGFYPMYDATYVSLIYVLMVALALLAFGLMLLRRYHREILDD